MHFMHLQQPRQPTGFWVGEQAEAALLPSRLCKSKNAPKGIPMQTCKLAALLLCAALLFSACAPSAQVPADTGDETDRRLTVEVLDVSYTEEEIARLSARIAEIMRRALYLADGMVPDTEWREDLQADIAGRRLESFRAHRVTAEELDRLCTSLEETLTELEAAQGSDVASTLSSAELLNAFYCDSVGLLGASRAGAILYDTALFWLDDRIEHCEERYEKYGYERYLREAEELREERRLLVETLGETAFADACATLVLTGTMLPLLVSSSAFADKLLTDAERLLLLQKQAEALSQKPISTAQWRTFFALFKLVEDNTNLLGGNLNVLQAAELDALLTADFISSLAEAMPRLLEWYGGLTRVLTAEEITEWRQGDADLRLSLLCRAILRDEAGFRAMLLTLSELLASATDAEAALIDRLGESERFSAYAAERAPTTADDLIAALSSAAAAPDGSAAEALSEALRAYFFSILPYATYAFDPTQEVSA